MVKIITICHGNICRSAMAAVILQKTISQMQLENEVIVDSAGVSAEEQGNPIDQRARKVLYDHGFDLSQPIIRNHAAKKLTKENALSADIFLPATRSQYDVLVNLFGIDSEKVYMYRSFEKLDKNGMPTSHISQDMIDPWYGDLSDFENTYSQINLTAKSIINFAANSN